MKTLIFLFISFAFVCNAQKLPQNNLADSLLKIEKINFMNSESDSLNGRMDPFTESAQIIYSPDSRFKIVSTIGESCGAYCNPYNMCWIYLARKNGNPLEKAYEFIDPVTSIQLLTKTKTYTDYLVLTQNWSKPRGIEAGETWNFYHLRAYADSIQFIKPIYIDKEKNSSWIYSADVICRKKENPGMWYNQKTKIISFMYYNYSYEENKCYLNTGKYGFAKGRFVEGETKKTEAEMNNE